MNGLLNAKEYAETKGVSHVAVHKWISMGKLGPIGDAIIKKGRLWLIDPQKADAYYSDNSKPTNQRTLFPDTLNESEEGTEKMGDKKPEKSKKNDRIANLNTYGGATTWKAKYEALLRQQEYEIKAGIYVLAEEVKAAAFNKARIIRDTLLNIPDRLSPILASELDQDKIYQLLSGEIKLALEELAK